MVFDLLGTKTCRIIWKLSQKLKFGFEPRGICQNSDFGHVRTYSWLHKLRNTQGKIYGTYLGKMYGIYQEYIRNIHEYLWYKIIRNTGPMGRPPKATAPSGRRRRRCLCFCLFYIINIYGYFLYMPHIFHIFFLNMFHIFSLVCFLIYGVKSRSGHDRSQSFDIIFTLRIENWLDEVISKWFCMVLRGEAQKT